MITKQDILKMVRAVHRHDRGLPPRRLIYPAREWGRGLVAALLLFVLTIGCSAALYLSLNTIEQNLEQPSVKTVTYNTTLAAQALDYYSERAQKFSTQTGIAGYQAPTPTSATSTDPLTDGGAGEGATATATTSPETATDTSEADDETAVETETAAPVEF